MHRRRFISCSVLAFMAAGCASLPPQALSTPSPLIDIWFLNIGYGDAALIRKDHSAAIIDGGYPVVTEKILKTLQTLKIQSLKSAVITHPHPDHIGGIYGILTSKISAETIYGAYEINDLTNPLGFRDFITTHNANYRVLRQGTTFEIVSGIRAEVLHPLSPVPDMNDSSIVIKIGNPGKGILFCGDIGPEPQQRLVDQYGSHLASQIIKAPHHGGELLPAFLEAVSPETCVISVGINPYGNPRPETIELLHRKKITTLRTDRDGTLHFQETENSRLEIVPRGTI